MNTKHTPTPWGIERTYDRNWIGPMRATGNKIAEIVVWTERGKHLVKEASERHDANAEFIVRAVNHHEELVELVQELIRWLDVIPIEYRNRPGFPANRARAVLAKLEAKR